MEHNSKHTAFFIFLAALLILTVISPPLDIITGNVIKDIPATRSLRPEILYMGGANFVDVHLEQLFIMLLVICMVITLIPHIIDCSKQPVKLRKFQKLTPHDMELILLMAGIWFFANMMLKELAISFNFIFSTFVFTSLLAFLALKVGKIGASTIFSILASLLSIPFPTFGFTGIEKIISMVSAALFFELVFLVVNVVIHGVPFDIFISAAIAATATPFIVASIISLNMVRNNFFLFAHWIITYFFIGIVAASISFFIWYNMRISSILNS